MKKLLALILLITSTTFAGGTVGNGGKIIICPDTNNPENLQIVDYYEAKVLRGWTPNVLVGNKNPVTLASLWVDRIKILNPSRYERLQVFLSSFMTETQFVSGQELVDIPDSNHSTYPEGCQVKQLAIQRQPSTAGEARYIINKDLWSRMDIVNQAGLILHEVIYREQILVNIETSSHARFFNSALASDQFRDMDQAQYLNFIKDFVPDVDFEGYNFAICRPGLVNGELNACKFREAPLLKQFNGEWLVQGFILPPWSPLAMGKRQFFSVKDPKSQIAANFIVYGPYQKDQSSFVVSHGADWLSQTGVNTLSYEGFYIRFTTNIFPLFDIRSTLDQHEKKCYEIWECQPQRRKELSHSRDWSQIVLTRNKKLLNFEVDFLTVPPGAFMRSCRDIVNLNEDGRISRCTGDGHYEDTEVKLVFEKSFVGWDDKGQIEFAMELKNAKILFQNNWISVRHVDWDNQSSHYLSGFTTEMAFHAKIGLQNILFTKGSFDLNSRKEIISFDVEDPVVFKIGELSLEINRWSIRGSDAQLIRLAKSTILKDSSGNFREYQPKWSILLDKNGTVIECLTAVGACL